MNNICEAGASHVYKYDGNNYVCRNCGKTVEYDIMERDFK